MSAAMEQKAATPVDASNSSSSSSGSRDPSPSAPLLQQVNDPKDPTVTTPPADGQSSSSSADSVKEEGLCAFRAGNWRGATDAWSRGLRTLEYILAKEDEFDDDKKKEFVAMQQSYLLNLSLSTLKEGRWAACILYCDKALKNDPTALKALYRKAQAQQELGDFDAALTTVDRYLDVSPESPLALSLQSQLRHQKAAHAIREKKLLQGMFRNLEHDPRSAASAAAVASPPNAGIHAQGGRPLQSIGKKIKGWFSRAGGDELKKNGEQQNTRQQEQESQQERQQQLAQQLRQQLWNERLAALNGGTDSVGKWPFPTADGARDAGSVTGDASQQAALWEAMLALGGAGGAEQSAAGAGSDIEQLARLVKMHQQLSSGSATFKDKFVFGLRLAWFGIRQFCSRGCQYFCRKRQTPQNKADEHQWEDELPVKAVPSRGASSEGRDGKPFVNRAQRRQQCRTAAAAAARRRMNHQTKCRSKIEDLDELEA